YIWSMSAFGIETNVLLLLLLLLRRWSSRLANRGKRRRLLSSRDAAGASAARVGRWHGDTSLLLLPDGGVALRSRIDIRSLVGIVRHGCFLFIGCTDDH